ncbi:MAG: hypothetical protein HY760_02750, partial [Nitrospirae bacterium]|nr:hypothetical protein [Nitrospirota bacterium]
AIAIASALHNVEGLSRISEYDGAGAIDMAAADYIAANSWWDGRSVTGGSFTAQKLEIATISLDAGERFRAALAYDSNPSSDYTSDPLEGNLNLYLYDMNDTLVAWSTRSSDSWEIIEWDVTTSGNYKLVVWNYSNSLASTETTYIGVAWWPGHYVLGTPIQTRGTPTSAQDHYRVDTASLAEWWAIALRPPAAANDNIYLYDGSRYDNPANFIWLEDSTLSGDMVDIVVMDRNHAAAKSYYPVVSLVSGAGSYDIQRAIMGGEISGGSASQTTTSLFVAKVWDIRMAAGITKYFSIVPTSGDADLGMILSDSDPLSSSTWVQGRSQAVASSDSAGAGGSESFTFNAGASDTMGLVVFNKRGQTVSTTWTLYVDETAPTGSISIDSGAAYTTTTGVTLTLSASDAQTGVSQMRFSNDNAAWTAWESYAAGKAWTLTRGDGTKTVYVQYKNNAGMTSGSFFDTIVLDATAPRNDLRELLRHHCPRCHRPQRNGPDQRGGGFDDHDGGDADVVVLGYGERLLPDAVFQ